MKNFKSPEKSLLKVNLKHHLDLKHLLQKDVTMQKLLEQNQINILDVHTLIQLQINVVRWHWVYIQLIVSYIQC